MKGRWFRLTIVVVLVILGNILLGFLLLRTPIAADLVFEQLQNYLQNKSGIDLQASEFRLDPLIGRVRMKDVVVRAASAADLPPILRIDSIDVRLGLSKIIHGFWDIEDLQLKAPNIHYVVQQDGNTNLPKTRTPASGPIPEFLLGSAEVEEGSFQYEDFRYNVAADLPRWQLQVDGNPLTLVHHINFTSLKESKFAYQDRAMPIDDLRFSATLQKTALRVNSARISAADSRISITGSLSDFSKPILDLQLEPEVDLDRIAQIMDLNKTIQGSVSGTILVRGPLGNLQIESQLHGKNIGAAEYPPAAYDIATHAEWKTESGQLLVPSLEIASSKGLMSAKAELFMKSEAGTNIVEAKIVDLDLFPVWKLLSPPFNLSSLVTGRISLQWKGAFHPSRISGSAHLNLTGTRETPGADLLPVSGIVDVKIRSGGAILNLHPVSVMGAQLNGEISLHPLKVMQGNIQGAVPNLDALIAQISQFLGKNRNPFTRFRIGGPASFDARISGKINNPNIEITAESPEMRVNDLKSIRVQADATIENSRIAFQKTIHLPEYAMITAQGSLRWQGPSPIFSLDARTDQMPIAAVAALFSRTLPIKGNLMAELHLSGNLDNLAGNAMIAGDELSLYQEPMGQIDANLIISGAEIRSSSFRLRKNPQNPNSELLEAHFGYDLGSGQFSFQANGKGLIFKQLMLPGDIPVEGTITLNASGTGTFAQPSIVFKLESADTRIKRRFLGPVALDGTLRNQELMINSRSSRFNTASTARLIVHDPFPFTGEVQIRGADLSLLGLKGAGDQPISGILEASATGSGNMKDLTGARGLARIQNLRLESGKLEIHTEGMIQAEYRDGMLEIYPAATIASGNSLLEIAGRVPLRKYAPTGSLLLKGEVDLAQAAGFLSLPEGYDVTGMLNLQLLLTGTLQSADSSGSVTVVNGVVKLPQFSAPLTGITLTSNVQGGSLLLEKAEADWGQGRVRLTGELPFSFLPKNIPVQFPRKEGPVLFTLDLEDVRPEAVAKLPEGVSGLISLHANGQTTGIDLRLINAQITFPTLSLKANAVSLDQRNPSIIVVRDGIATISRLSMTGPDISLEVSGSAGLFPDSTLDLGLDGDFEAALLTLKSQDLRAAGKAQVHIDVTGTRNNPSLTGWAEMNGGRLSLRNPRAAVDNLKVRLNLEQNHISIQQFAGSLNGGSLDAEGTVRYRDGSLNDFNVEAVLQDCYLNILGGLKSVSRGTITLMSSNDSIVVGGDISVQESSFREPIEIGGQIMSYLRSQQLVDMGRRRSEFLERINLNIALQTETPLLVQNNLAKVEADTNLRLVGSYYEPSLVGRIALNEGGEISLNQRTYYISRGIITLSNQSRIEPELDIRAQTEVGDHNVTLYITGTPERLMTTLTSEPPESEADILSLLLTGRKTSEMEGREAIMARTQALSLLAGQAGEQIASQARQTLGLSTVRIDPGLISSESDPGARLTLGQDITSDFSLAYSMNLVDGGDQIWAARYSILRGITTQATKQEDNSYRFEFRHNLQFGGPFRDRASSGTVSKFEIGTIEFKGNSLFSNGTLLDQLEVKPGTKYDFAKIQKGLDRLLEFYAEQKKLEADIRLDRETRQGTVDLNLDIKSGPTVDFFFDGAPISETTKQKVKQAWIEGVFDTERLDEALLAIQRPLLKQGYFQSEVTYKIETAHDHKRVYFHINPGARFTNVKFEFPGASAISASKLGNALDQADLQLDAYADPQTVVDYLTRFYYERGYLQASVDLPHMDLDPKTGTGRVAIAVQEGPLFTIGNLEFDGNHAFDYDQLWIVIPTSSGSRYDPDTLQDAVRALQGFYHSHGYNEVTVTYRTVQDSQAAHAHVTFLINEYRQSIIRDITIEGTGGTSESFVRRQLDFQPGDVLDFTRINESRKRLYDTGVYALVDFQTKEILTSEPDSLTKDVGVRVRVREIRPYRLQYGFFYDTDRGPGGIAEMRDSNLLGRAADLGLRLRYDSDFKEARLFFYQPFVTKIHLKTDASAFYQRETPPSYDATRVGFSLIQQKRLPKEFRLDYGYRFDYVRLDEGPQSRSIYVEDSQFGRFITTLSRDTRDSILDATRGEFSSHSLEIGPTWLGSKFLFTRYYGQYFRYVPLDKFIWRQRWNELGRKVPPRLLYSGALRFGLIKGFGENDIPRQERFYAGGGTTMRGFQQDMLGPTFAEEDGTVKPVGGEAVFLFNNEIRFPIFGILHGVGFLDIGNTYENISDLKDNFSLRETAGLGLRIKIKFIPLRFDYGFKLDRRPGESKGAFFFSIGQAF